MIREKKKTTILLERNKNKQFGLFLNTENEMEDKTSLIWSIFIFVCNLRCLLFTIFWASADQSPQGALLVSELIFEYILLIEAFVRIILRNRVSLRLYHSKIDLPRWRVFFLLIGSFPIFNLSIFFNQGKGVLDIFNYLNLVKVIRALPETHNFIEYIEETLFYKNVQNIVYMKLVKTFVFMFYFAHFAACSWQMLQKNLLSNNNSYWIRANITNASLGEKYVHALSWGVSSLIGNSFGFTVPQTFLEDLFSAMFLTVGSVVFAKNFADFDSLLNLLNLELETNKTKFEQAREFCYSRKLPKKYLKKIKEFYNLDHSTFAEMKYYKDLKRLPRSLENEIAIYRNQDLIQKCAFFNFGSPSFILAIARYLEPRIVMEGDTILRVGDFGEELYFIKSGKVEILAEDNKTQIAVLCEGSFFGEIALLISGTRTVNVKALVSCRLEIITKDNFFQVMKDYPDQLEFIKRVACQRNKICTVKQLAEETNYTPAAGGRVEKKHNSFVKRSQTHLKTKSIRELNEKSDQKSVSGTIFDNIYNKNLKKLFKVVDGIRRLDILDLSKRNTIKLNSTFYRYWAPTVVLTYFLTSMLMLYVFTFGLPDDTPGYFLEFFVAVVFILDIYINFKTDKENEELSHKECQLIYMKREFLLDLIAALPISTIFYLVDSPSYMPGLFKVITLLKFNRCSKLLRYFRENSKFGRLYTQIASALAWMIIAMNIFACCMYFISVSENKRKASFNGKDMIGVYDANSGNTPLLSQSSFNIWIAFLYWAFTTTGGAAAFDLSAQSPLEVLFQIMCGLTFKLYLTYMIAKFAYILKSHKSGFLNYLEKAKLWEDWMQLHRIPNQTVDKVKNYHKLIWEKFRGLEENKILEDLPVSIQFEIRVHLLQDVLENVEIFPKHEKGFITNLLRVLRFAQVPEGEYVFKKGDLAFEMYFIVEGTALVYDDEDARVIATLKKNDFFGEMAIISGKPNSRTRSIKAAENLSLALLQLSDFNNLCATFPNILHNIQRAVENRKIQNKQIKFLKPHTLVLDSLTKSKIDIKDDNKPLVTPGIFKKVHLASQGELAPHHISKYRSQYIAPSGKYRNVKSQLHDVKHNLMKNVNLDPSITLSAYYDKSKVSVDFDNADKVLGKLEYSAIMMETEEDESDMVDLKFSLVKMEAKKLTTKPTLQTATDEQTPLGHGKLNSFEETQTLNKAFQASQLGDHNRVKFIMIAIRLCFSCQNCYNKLKSWMIKNNEILWRVNRAILFFVYLFQQIYIPLYLSITNIRYEGISFGLEVFSTLYLFICLLFEIREFSIMRSSIYLLSRQSQFLNDFEEKIIFILNLVINST